MLSKSKLNLLMAFSLISLVSVGFSSWNISFTNEMIVNGSFDVDEVYTNETFVNVDSIESFRYYNTGFLTDDNKISTKGTIAINLTVDVNKCKEEMGNISSVNVELILKYANRLNQSYDIFNHISVRASDNYSVSDSYSSSTWTHTTYATIPTLSDSDISFTVYYDFEIDANEFKESTFAFLQSNAFSLIVMV